MKSFIKTSLIYFFIFELIFQFLIFFNFKFIKIPDLFYNGYCDQKYWNFNEREILFNSETEYHPILSYVKKDLAVPKSLKDSFLIEDNNFESNKISLYGSSYLNHKEFKLLINNNENLNYKNYALNSYGLDQIFLSYKLTAHLNQNRTIIFGFLLEDLDRSIFYNRDYEKVLIKNENSEFIITNTPVNIEKKNSSSFDFYLIKFLSNFKNLIKNDFDPRLDKCHISKKEDLLNYYINEILKTSSKFNQKLVFITFNLKEDLIKKPTWRYETTKKLLKNSSIIHVDSYALLKNKSQSNLDEINTYFGDDKHNNKKSFEYIIDDLFRKL